MDLVNEYLRAVAALLPRAQRDDIVAELRDTILSRLEEREAELGRPPTDDEIEAVLREVGHPVVIAARYREGPQHVVGPTLYPYWLFAVKAVIALQIATAVIVVLVRTVAFGNFSQILSQAIGSGVTGGLTLIGAATCVAWFIERRGTRLDYLDKWRVRELRYLEIVSWDFDTLREWMGGRKWPYPHDRSRHGPTPPAPPPSAASGPAAPKPGAPRPAPPASMSAIPPMPPSWHPVVQATSRGIGFIAVGTLLVLWWTGVLPVPFGLGPVDWARLNLSLGALADVDWSAMRALLFWPVLAYGVLVILQGAMLLAHPFAVRLQGLMDAVRGLVLLAFCAWLWTLSPMANVVAVTFPADFISRMAMFADTPPLPLEPVATLAVLCTGLSACGRMVRGLLNLAFGHPPFYVDAHMPPPGMTSSAR